LRYAAQNFDDYYTLSKGYSYSNKFQDMADAFNKRVVSPFISHIVSYLDKLMIDLGGEEQGTISIGSVEQLNLSQGSSSITAVNRGNLTNNDLQTILELSERFLISLQTEKLSQENKEDIKDMLETMIEQMQSEKPKKGLIRTGTEMLKDSLQLMQTGTSAYIALQAIINEFTKHISNIPPV